MNRNREQPTRIRLVLLFTNASPLFFFSQDLTSAPQSALSLRVMLNLPHVGWRVHQVLITPALVMSVISACVGVLAGNMSMLSAIVGGGEPAAASPTAAPTAPGFNMTFNTTEL